MSSQQTSRYVRARNDVLQAIREIRRNKLHNPHISEKRVSYMEIRCWIKLNLGYEIENVGARCRELARDVLQKVTSLCLNYAVGFDRSEPPEILIDMMRAGGLGLRR